MRFESEVLTPETAALLHRLGELLSEKDFYLAGGTALAIHLGHRKSIDLDFFGQAEFDPLGLEQEIRSRFQDPIEIQVAGSSRNTLNLFCNGTKVDILRYNYPMLEKAIRAGNYLLAGVPDIAAMKLSAVTNRGSRKDFFDLNRLLDEFSLGELLDFYSRKFSGHDRFMVIRALTYFEDAENEPDPVMLSAVNWATVKQSIQDQVGNYST